MGNGIRRALFILMRLYRNQAGNTLAIVAAAIIPLMGLVGGGVDMSRLYLTKARLQQACDAGALAGRKQMGAGAWSASSNKANTVALQLFDANFQSGSYGTGTRTRSFAESSGKVTGTATVDVPMTIMRIFGQYNKTITVVCDAEMRIPNSDVMFVLDTTGSMNDPTPGDTTRKIDGLKKAVKCFYEALAKIDIDNVDCGSTPSGGNSSTVQLRFGFVPYATNVNVGKLLSNAWVEDYPRYQTRVPLYGTTTIANSSTGTSGSYGDWVNLPNMTTASEAACLALVPADDYAWTGTESGANNTQSSSSGSTTTTTWSTTQSGEYRDYEMRDWSSGSGRCRIRYRPKTASITRNYSQTTSTTQTAGSTFVGWIYQQAQLDVRGLKAGGSSWNNSVTLPIGDNGTNTSVSWDGCIEERQTWKNTDGDPSNDFSPIPSTAWDMDIDMVPTSDRETQWKPVLRDAVWGRQNGSGSWTTDPVNTTTWGAWVNWMPRDNFSYTCPRPARKLTSYKTSAEVTDFKTYVDALTPAGNTYHDIGMIWGARLMSPTGLFAGENAFTPNGGTIERHMIFMTDGAAAASSTNLLSYGIPWWDRRQANSTNTDVLKGIINARLSALCTVVKNKNITLWVIYYGAVGSDDYTRLFNCASTGRFYNATNSTQLIDKFKAIANEISQLRLTQ